LVSTMLWPLYPQERLGTHCTESWVAFAFPPDGKKPFAPNGV